LKALGETAGVEMTTDEAITIFSAFSPGEKADFLAALMHELTVVARDSYEVGDDGLTNPRRVRRINEIQHRLSGFLWALLRDNPRRYPDDVIIKIVLEYPDDHTLAQHTSTAFARLVARDLTRPKVFQAERSEDRN